MRVQRFPVLLVLLAVLAIVPARAAVLDTVGGTTGGQLGSDLVADFSFSGSLQMYSSTGTPVLSRPDDTIRGRISLDVVTAGGTAEMSSAVGFFGVNWRMHEVALNACGKNLTVNTRLLFDWGPSRNIPVFSTFVLKPAVNSNVSSWKSPSDGLTFTVDVIDTDGDGIPGQRMASGPFRGYTPVFAGTATVMGMRRGYYPNQHVTVGSSSACTPLGSSVGGFF